MATNNSNNNNNSTNWRWVLHGAYELRQEKLEARLTKKWGHRNYHVTVRTEFLLFDVHSVHIVDANLLEPGTVSKRPVHLPRPRKRDKGDSCSRLSAFPCPG